MGTHTRLTNTKGTGEMLSSDDILFSTRTNDRRATLRITLAALLGCLLMMATLVVQSNAQEHAATTPGVPTTQSIPVKLQ